MLSKFELFLRLSFGCWSALMVTLALFDSNLGSPLRFWPEETAVLVTLPASRSAWVTG